MDSHNLAEKFHATQWCDAVVTNSHHELRRTFYLELSYQSEIEQKPKKKKKIKSLTVWSPSSPHKISCTLRGKQASGPSHLRILICPLNVEPVCKHFLPEGSEYTLYVVGDRTDNLATGLVW